MSGTFAATMEWVRRTVFGASDAPAEGRGGESNFPTAAGSRRRWGEVPSPGVRPLTGRLDVVRAGDMPPDGVSHRPTTFAPLSFSPSSSFPPRQDPPRSRLRGHGDSSLEGSHSMMQRFAEVFRRWGSASSVGGTSVHMEAGDKQYVSPASSWTTGNVSPTPSRSRGRSSQPRPPQPQQPVSADDMQRRVTSAALSQWELPLMEERRHPDPQVETEIAGVEEEHTGGRMLFVPAETPQPRLSLGDDVSSCRSLPAVPLSSHMMTMKKRAREREVQQLAFRICEVGTLLQRGSEVGGLFHSRESSGRWRPLLSEHPRQSPHTLEEDKGPVHTCSSLLASVDTWEDRRVRAVYEGTMSTVCRATVEEEVVSYLQLMEGVALRALERWVMEAVLKEVGDAIKNLLPGRALSQGIEHHIKGGKAADVRALLASEEDKESYNMVVRRGGNHGVDLAQAQDTAVSFKSGLSLTYRQLATLAPGQWLNDQVINAYLSMICEERNALRGKEVAVSLGTHFYARVEQELRGRTSDAETLPPLLTNSGVLRWLRRRRHVLQPGTTRIVLVPVNLSQTHWALAVLNWELCTWFYYDSYIHGKSAVARGELILRQLAHAFSESWRILCGDDVSRHVDCRRVVAAAAAHGNDVSAESGFAVAPQQTNSYDCGVFVCCAAWCAVNGVAMDFTQCDVTASRRVMLHELFCQRGLPRFPVSTFLAP